MLMALALALESPAPVSLDAALVAFDAACVAPGPDVNSERVAIAKLKATLDPKQSTAPAALEGYQLGGIDFLLIPNPKGSSCGLTTVVTPDATGEQLSEMITVRYSIIPKSSIAARQSRAPFGRSPIAHLVSSCLIRTACMRF